MAGEPVFRNLAELESIHLRQAVEIYAATFYEPLSFISNDLDLIADVLEHAFVRDRHYVALLDGNVVAVVSISDAQGRPQRYRREFLTRRLGLLKGSLAYFRLRGVFGQPINLEQQQCYIDYVVTDSAFRGMGIASELQRHLFGVLPYKEYLLEVAEMNFRAIRMYEELGFSVENRKPQRSFWKPNLEGGKLSMRRIMTEAGTNLL